MRVLAIFALLAAPAMAFMPAAPFKAPRAASAMIVRMHGSSEKVSPPARGSRWGGWLVVCWEARW